MKLILLLAILGLAFTYTIVNVQNDGGNMKITNANDLLDIDKGEFITARIVYWNARDQEQYSDGAEMIEFSMEYDTVEEQYYMLSYIKGDARIVTSNENDWSCCSYFGDIEFVSGSTTDYHTSSISIIPNVAEGTMTIDLPAWITFSTKNNVFMVYQKTTKCGLIDDAEHWIEDERLDKRLHLWMEFTSEREDEFANTCTFNFMAYFEDFPITNDDQTEGGFVCFAHQQSNCRSKRCLRKGDVGFLVKGTTNENYIDRRRLQNYNYPKPNPYYNYYTTVATDDYPIYPDFSDIYETYSWRVYWEHMIDSGITHVVATDYKNFVPLFKDHIWDHDYEYYENQANGYQDMCNYFDFEGQSWTGQLDILKVDIPHEGHTLERRRTNEGVSLPPNYFPGYDTTLVSWLQEENPFRCYFRRFDDDEFSWNLNDYTEFIDVHYDATDCIDNVYAKQEVEQPQPYLETYESYYCEEVESLLMMNMLDAELSNSFTVFGLGGLCLAAGFVF